MWIGRMQSIPYFVLLVSYNNLRFNFKYVFTDYYLVDKCIDGSKRRLADY